MKNSHGVEPTRFIKKNQSTAGIQCIPTSGPIFGNYLYYDIYIDDDCQKEKRCKSDNNLSSGFECHPEYQSSLFIKTKNTIIKNYFTILDYEVFAQE